MFNSESHMEKEEYVYKNVEIHVVTGDITEQRVDAVVNPANSLMVMGGGVAGAIKRAGGKEIEEEAVKQAPVPVGKAIVTKAGKLAAKHVIHTPTMKKPAMHIDKENVKLAMKAALESANQLRIKSVAFPGLGTGVGGLKKEEAAKIMMHELKKHIDNGTTLEKIVFVGFSEDMTNAFVKALRDF